MKPVTDFYKRGQRGPAAVQSHCKICNAECRVSQTRANRRRGIALLGGRCVRCGYDTCDHALHFHHPAPELKDDLFHRLRNRKWEYIKQVLVDQRVELLCANCHAEWHAGALPLS